METLDIKPSPSTPQVKFDPITRTLEISGESYPENSFAFYQPIISWLEAYLESAPSFTFAVKMVYMNSSSIKCILDMLDIMTAASERGAEVSVIWYYDPENPRALDLAEEFREEVTLPFQIVALTL